MKYDFTASIVLYKNDIDELKLAVDSFLSVKLNTKLYLVDNSPDDSLKNISTDERIVYIHNPANPGFGAGHNMAINHAINANSKYHFIINPDVYFNGEVLISMVNYMGEHLNIGMLMPEVLYPNGDIQNLPKLLPTPLNILLRKLKKPAGAYKKFIDKYELRFVPRETIYNAPILSGCFTLLNMEAVKQVGMYDDRYFMYFEDWDLSRRMNINYNTVYYPAVSVYHAYDSGANKSLHLFKVYIKSCIHYFNKWGWLFDKKRREINIKTLAQFK